jgi:hypothetical protein
MYMRLLLQRLTTLGDSAIVRATRAGARDLACYARAARACYACYACWRARSRVLSVLARAIVWLRARNRACYAC